MFNRHLVDIEQALTGLPASFVSVFRLVSKAVVPIVVFFTCLPVFATPVTSFLEVDAQVVGSAFQTWSFDNAYISPVPVCTYVLPSSADEPAAVRIDNITSTSMQIRLQEPRNGSGITAFDVHCIIAEEGLHTLSDGTNFEAHTVLSTNTVGFSPGWANADLEDVSAVIGHTYTNPVVLGQVISYNDPNFSTFFSNDCDARGNRPFQSGMADGICVGKHINKDNVVTTRANETLGYIVVESGTATVNGVQFQIGLGPDNIRGVTGNPPYSYALNDTYTYGVATQEGQDGGQGGWAVMYGNDPLAADQMDLAIDEDNLSTNRSHTTEQAGFWVFKKVASITLEKTVINDNGGTNSNTDFILSFDNGAGRTGSGFEGELAINDAAVSAGSFTLSESALPGYALTAINCDGADADGLDGLVISAGEFVTCTFINDDQGVDIEVIKTVSDTTPNIGDTITFTLQIINNGPDVATDVSVSDVVTAGFGYVSSSISGGASNDDSNPGSTGLSWLLSAIGSGNSAFVDFQAILLAP